MLFRRLDEASVARNAALMAERKAAEGCTDCAEAYRHLARTSRRRLLTRAGGFAAAGLAVSMVDAGGALAAIASSTKGNPLGGWIRDPQQVLAAVLNSPAYVEARNHLVRTGVDVGEQGMITRLPSSRNPLRVDAYSIVQSFAGGVLQAHLTQSGLSSAVATLLLKGRWIVERTFGWLNLSRRLSKDYEVLPASSEAFIRLALLPSRAAGSSAARPSAVRRRHRHRNHDGNPGGRPRRHDAREL